MMKSNRQSARARHLQFLGRLNQVRYHGKPLSELLLPNGYNIWHTYQQQLLSSDIPDALSQQGASCRRYGLKDVAVELYLIFYSLISFSIVLLSRRTVLLYSLDKLSDQAGSYDFRVAYLYSFLKKEHIPFFEVIHTVLGRETLIHSLKRRRACIYLEAIDSLYWTIRPFAHSLRKFNAVASDFDLSPLLPSERAAGLSLAQKYVQRIDLSLFRIAVFKYIIRLSGVRALFAIDDVRHYHELILAGRLSNVPSAAFQHGHLTKYHVGWLVDDRFLGTLICPDTYVVWSSYWKKELIRLGTYFPKHSMIIGGNAKQKDMLKRKRKSKSSVTILYPYEKAGDTLFEIRAYLEELLRCPGVVLYFKLRQDIPKEVQMKEFNLASFADTRNFKAIVHLDEALSHIDLAVGTYSTLLYEMVERGIPTALFKTSSDFGEGMIANGLADTLEDSKNLCTRVQEIAATSEVILKKRRDMLVPLGTPSIDDTLRELSKRLTLRS